MRGADNDMEHRMTTPTKAECLLLGGARRLFCADTASAVWLHLLPALVALRRCAYR